VLMLSLRGVVICCGEPELYSAALETRSLACEAGGKLLALTDMRRICWEGGSYLTYGYG
jgi:hypothetical protein